MNAPDQNPKPRGWAEVQPLVLAHIAQMAPHQKIRSGGKLLISACERIAELEKELAELRVWKDAHEDDRRVSEELGQ